MRKNVILSKYVALFIVFVMAFSGTSIFAAESDKFASDLKSSNVPDDSYNGYLKRYAGIGPSNDTILLDARSNISYKSDNVEIHNDFLSMGSIIQLVGENGAIQWDVQIKKEGFYNVLFDYYPLESKYVKIDYSIYVDGKIPFTEAGKLSLTRSWKNKHKIQSDSRGNNISPRQIPAPTFLESYAYDSEGVYNENLRFYFSKGSHTLKIASSRSDFILRSIKLEIPKPLPSYSDISSNYCDIPKLHTENIIIEGENASFKSDSTMIPTYDRSDPDTSPSDPTKLLLNTIGGSKWKDIGQWLAWEVEVPEDGYYEISMRARQNTVNGRNSYRRVYIDGDVRFSELNAVEFRFENDWYMKTLGDEEPYLFYLSKGKHEIKLEVVPGELSEIRYALQDYVFRMNDIYRKIIMITGTTPDPYRDYRIYDDIPDIIDTFSSLRDGLAEQKLNMEEISGEKGGSSGLLESLINQLNSFVTNPDSIPLRLDNYKANISSLSAWLLSLTQQPLEIDYLEVSSAGNEITSNKHNIFQRLFFSLRSLIGSFGADYSMVGDFDNDDEAITVWVGLGRDQVQVVKHLVDNDFVPRTGIKVNVSLVQQGLIEATLAGKGPDIALFVDSTQPVNLAARGALVDLKQFSDYNEVSKRFANEAFVPFSYKEGIYALPCTQSFPMLFYRKDVFSELGVNPPKTWDDVYRIAPVLQRNNLSIGIGSDIGTFATLLYQKGGRFYNDQGSSTELDRENAMSAFTQWTDFFRKYSLPLTYDFQNRFRTGEMPLGIAPYTVYNMLQVSAPEIKNLWEMTTVPATVRADGTLDYSVCGGGMIEGGIMFEKAENKDAVWEFLKWFTNADIQGKLGIDLESQMGSAARYATANVEALKYLPWNQDELSLLYKQWNNVKEIPQIPASYYITRNITNAFRKVVYDNENPRNTLNQYNYEMNKEVKRKRIEFDLDEK